MNTSMQKPILASVVALEVRSMPGSQGEAALNGLLRHIHTLANQNCSIQLQARNNAAHGITVIMPPETQVGSVLRRCLHAMKNFEADYPGSQAHALIHHGVVFMAEEDGQVSHVGSAIKLAHSSLRRLENQNPLVASADFCKHAREWSDRLFRLSPLGGAAASEGLHALHLIDTGNDQPKTAQIPPEHPALLAFLNARLAADVGPFASVLVEAARSIAPSAKALVLELAQEVDAPQARDDFTRDCLNWINQQEQA